MRSWLLEIASVGMAWSLFFNCSRPVVGTYSAGIASSSYSSCVPSVVGFQYEILVRNTLQLRLSCSLSTIFLCYETSRWVLMILLKKLARDALVHFLLIGILIYGIFGLLKSEPTEDPEHKITVTQGQIKALTD